MAKRKWHEAGSENDKLVDFSGRTALHLAADCGNDGIVAQVLAANPSDLNVGDRKRWSALHYAAIQGHCTIVTQLLTAGAMVYATDDCGRTALHFAASKGHETVVATLLAHPQIEVAARDEQGETALHVAANHGHDGVVAQLLADPRIAVDASGCDCTALHYAARNGHDKVVERLLADGRTQINARDSKGYTALHMAVEAGKDRAVDLLLSQDSIEMDSKTIHEAICMRDEELVLRIMAKFPVSDVERWLHDVDDLGWNTFRLAVSSGCEQAVSQMLVLSPSLMDNPEFGHNVLQTAVVHGHGNLLDKFLAMKPEWASSVDVLGGTLLHLAFDSNPFSSQVFTRLWSLPSSIANLRVANKFGWTPFTVALRKSCDFAIDLMQWKLSIDEILDALSHAPKVHVGRFRPVVEAECAGLLNLLNRDVLGTVFEYLSFERRRNEGEHA